MKIPEKAIVDHLKEHISDVRVDTETQFEFSGIRQLTGRAVTLRQDVLYICGSAERMAGRETECASVCKLIRQADYEKCGGIENSIVIKNDSDLSEVADDILCLFEKASEFTETLQSAIISDSSIDDIFSLAAQNFPGCLIVMTDTAYNIVHSTETEVRDEYLNALLRRGYYDKNDIDMIANHGYFEDWQRVMKPRLYTAEETVSGKSMLLRSYQSRGLLLGFIACYFLDREPSEIDYILFKSFTDSVERIMLSYMQHSAYETSDEQMITDMLSPENRSNAILMHDRSLRLDLPLNANFRIGVIRSEGELESIAASVTKHLLVYCPIKTYGVFKYRSEVVLVFYDWNYYTVKESSALGEKMQMLINTLQASKCRVGISLGFDKIDSFSVAYEQARSALTESHKLLGKDSSPIHFYSEFYLQDMLSVYEKKLPLDAVYARQLDALADGRHNECDNLTFLYVYLRAERNIAATARLLNMHRNGATYRINRIMELLGLDLDNADTRLRIMISYEILKKMGKFSADYAPADSAARDETFEIQKD